MSSGDVRVSLRVQPNAPRNEVVCFSEGVLRIKIAAPPVKGKANQELVGFLSKELGLGKSSLTIIKGYQSRNKVITVSGLSLEEVMRRLFTEPSASGGASK